jgi:hypothetical protein
MQIGQGFLMSRAQVKIAGVGSNAKGKFCKSEMFLIHRMFGFGTAVRSRTSLPGEICVIASTALLEREPRRGD